MTMVLLVITKGVVLRLIQQKCVLGELLSAVLKFAQEQLQKYTEHVWRDVGTDAHDILRSSEQAIFLIFCNQK